MIAALLAAVALAAGDPPSSSETAAPGAAAAPPASHIDVEPKWLRRPSADDLARVFPWRASVRHLSGRAVMECVVADTGRMRDCRLLSEEPPGAGFGDAELQLAPQFKLQLPVVDGAVVHGPKVVIPVRFVAP